MALFILALVYLKQFAHTQTQSLYKGVRVKNSSPVQVRFAFFTFYIVTLHNCTELKTCIF